jgi:hypothetical protein
VCEVYSIARNVQLVLLQCSTHGAEERGVQGFGGPLGTPTCRWKVDIKITFAEVRCGEVWTGLIWYRIGKWRALVIAEMSLRVP